MYSEFELHLTEGEKQYIANMIRHYQKVGFPKEDPLVVEADKRGLVALNEAGILRILSHGKTGFVILSANRSVIAPDDGNPDTDLTPKYQEFLMKTGAVDDRRTKADWLRRRNKEADQELKRDIQATGYSYTPVFGGYHGSDSVVDSFEPTYIVYNKDRKGNTGNFKDLFNFAIAMCGKYKQDSVYVQAPGQSPNYYNCHGVKVNTTTSMDFAIDDSDREYFTTNKRQKRGNPSRFTNTGLGFDPIDDAKPNEWFVRKGALTENFNRFRLSSLGEIFLV